MMHLFGPFVPLQGLLKIGLRFYQRRQRLAVTASCCLERFGKSRAPSEGERHSIDGFLMIYRQLGPEKGCQFPLQYRHLFPKDLMLQLLGSVVQTELQPDAGRLQAAILQVGYDG